MAGQAAPDCHAASKIAFLLMRDTWNSNGQRLREMGQRLGISVIGMPIDESTPSEYQRVFAEIVPQRPDAIIVHDRGELLSHRQLIVQLVEKSRLPAMYGAREFIEVGGLMTYQADQGEAGRRMADRRARDPGRRQPGRHISTWSCRAAWSSTAAS